MERTPTMWSSWETFRRTERFIFKVTLTIDWVFTRFLPYIFILFLLSFLPQFLPLSFSVSCCYVLSFLFPFLSFSYSFSSFRFVTDFLCFYTLSLLTYLQKLFNNSERKNKRKCLMSVFISDKDTAKFYVHDITTQLTNHVNN